MISLDLWMEFIKFALFFIKIDSSLSKLSILSIKLLSFSTSSLTLFYIYFKSGSSSLLRFLKLDYACPSALKL